VQLRRALTVKEAETKRTVAGVGSGARFGESRLQLSVGEETLGKRLL